MRYLTLTILLSGALAAQTQNWRQPNLQQYFRQFKFPEVQRREAAAADEPRKCAIPLIKVLKKDTTNDHMVFHPNPAGLSKMPVVTPPAPSCDDVR
jgi:hypothetical protein